jgi:hypothetical protein
MLKVRNTHFGDVKIILQLVNQSLFGIFKDDEIGFDRDQLFDAQILFWQSAFRLYFPKRYTVENQEN